MVASSLVRYGYTDKENYSWERKMKRMPTIFAPSISSTVISSCTVRVNRRAIIGRL